jgi:hypothetical protein
MPGVVPRPQRRRFDLEELSRHRAVPGWKPAQPALIPDLDRARYFER